MEFVSMSILNRYNRFQDDQQFVDVIFNTGKGYVFRVIPR